MKFRVTMKDPDTLHDAIEEAVKETLEDMPADEKAVLKECRIEKAQKICGHWFEYGEYLTVEIDTDAKTCVVVSKE